MRKLILPLIAVVIVCGCSTTTVQLGRPIKVADVKNIEPGKTTKTEVLKKFGPPASITVTSAGFESYMFVDAATNNHTLTLPPILIIYVDGVASTIGKALVVNFRGDVVANYAYTVNSLMGAAQAGSTQGFQGMALDALGE